MRRNRTRELQRLFVFDKEVVKHSIAIHSLNVFLQDHYVFKQINAIQFDFGPLRGVGMNSVNL